MALAQLAWSYPSDTSIDDTMLITLLQQFDEASIPLAIALALQARGVSDAASFAFNTAFAQAESEASDDRADGGRVVAALRALRLRL